MTTTEAAAPQGSPSKSRRLAALDVFRGATVAAMIFVNNPGDWAHLLWPFGHAEWHGATPTDLIFPFFLFIAGTAGILSLRKRRASGATTRTLAWHALTRGAAIVLLGWAGSAFPFTPERLLNLRIPGVLPRIGVVYILGTWLVLLVDEENPAVRGLVSRLGAAILALLALHTFLLLGLGYDLTRLGNIQRAVDLALLRGHLWKKDWDPEGIVSTLTAVATFLTGSVAGICVLAKRPLRERAGILAVWGAVGAALGLLLHPLLPINKNLWTASYVVFTSGAASLCLGALLGTMKEEPKSRLTAHVRGFFATFGTNPLLAFLGSGLLARCLGLVKWTTAAGPVSLQAFLYKNGLGWLPDPYLASHAWAALNVLVWWGILRALEKRGVFWKV